MLRQRNGASVILITHDLAVIWRMAGRVMVMKDGAVIESGPTAEVFSSPKDPYTAALLSSATRVKRLGDDEARSTPTDSLAHAV